ncbi:MAG TPA: hypothetical protein VML75_00125, partial [Kofleriaceae bacterium]|nr:hypothetical protein [Kofleriaceae bacterium]
MMVTGLAGPGEPRGEPVRQSETLSQRIAGEVGLVLDVLEALQRDVIDAGRGVSDAWGWLESLDTWEVRTSAGAWWIRELGNGADTVLGLL